MAPNVTEILGLIYNIVFGDWYGVLVAYEVKTNITIRFGLENLLVVWLELYNILPSKDIGLVIALDQCRNEKTCNTSLYFFGMVALVT